MGVNMKRGGKGRRDGRRGEGRGFSEVWNSNCKYGLQCQFALPCQILCRSAKPFRRYGCLLNFSSWRPSAILDFQTLEILTPYTHRRAKIRHHTKFCANQSNRCGDTAVFDFSRWRPSAILDLFYACLDHPRSVFWWSLSLYKIWFESVQ